MKSLNLREWLMGDTLKTLIIDVKCKDKVISILKEFEKNGYFEKEGKEWRINELSGELFTLDITNDLRKYAYDEII